MCVFVHTVSCVSVVCACFYSGSCQCSSSLSCLNVCFNCPCFYCFISKYMIDWLVDWLHKPSLSSTPQRARPTSQQHLGLIQRYHRPCFSVSHVVPHYDTYCSASRCYLNSLISTVFRNRITSSHTFYFRDPYMSSFVSKHHSYRRI